MTISYNSVTDDITITSTQLADFGVITSAVLTGGLNCPTTLTYSDTIVTGDVTSNAFVVDKTEFFGSADNLADGVYSFVLTVTSTSNVITTETGCLFIDNDTACTIAKLVHATNCDTLELKTNYYLLSNAGHGDRDWETSILFQL
jgi:hypothetical protein